MIEKCNLKCRDSQSFLTLFIFKIKQLRSCLVRLKVCCYLGFDDNLAVFYTRKCSRKLKVNRHSYSKVMLY